MDPKWLKSGLQIWVQVGLSKCFMLVSDWAYCAMTMLDQVLIIKHTFKPLKLRLYSLLDGHKSFTLEKLLFIAASFVYSNYSLFSKAKKSIKKNNHYKITHNGCWILDAEWMNNCYGIILFIYQLYQPTLMKLGYNLTC